MQSSDFAEFHNEPIPHLVFSEETWAMLKANPSAPSARDTFDVSGQIGVMSGTPVYINECPWSCREQQHSGATEENQ